LMLAEAAIWLSGPPAWAGLSSSVLLMILAVPSLRRVVALKGRRAVTSLEWTGREWYVWLARQGRRLPAVPEPRSSRLVGPLWILHFACPEGRLAVLLDTGLHDQSAIRHLSRCLAATIRPKA
jgi:hypothetical protein